MRAVFEPCLWLAVVLLLVISSTSEASASVLCRYFVSGFHAPFKQSLHSNSRLATLLNPTIQFLSTNLPGIRWANHRALMLSNRPAHQNVFSRGLELTQITYDLFSQSISEIPRRGPVIFVSNHRGMDDALIDGDWALRLRPDLKFVIGLNASMLPDLHPYAFTVDNSEIRNSDINARNSAFLKKVLRHLTTGALFWYPSDTMDERADYDYPVEPHPFHPGLGLVIARTEATVVPVYHVEELHPLIYDLRVFLKSLHPRLGPAILPLGIQIREGKRLTTIVGRGPSRHLFGNRRLLETFDSFLSTSGEPAHANPSPGSAAHRPR